MVYFQFISTPKPNLQFQNNLQAFSSYVQIQKLLQWFHSAEQYGHQS